MFVIVYTPRGIQLHLSVIVHTPRGIQLHLFIILYTPRGIQLHWSVIIPPANRVCGVYRNHSVHPSVHPSVRPSMYLVSATPAKPLIGIL